MSPPYGLLRIASKATLTRRKSSDESRLRSRSAGLVITKSDSMPPLVKRDELALLVSKLSFGYNCLFFIGRLLDADPS